MEPVRVYSSAKTKKIYNPVKSRTKLLVGSISYELVITQKQQIISMNSIIISPEQL